MATTGNGTNLYPTVHGKENGKPSSKDDPDVEARLDLLTTQDNLAQEVSSTAVLTPAATFESPEDDRGNWSGRFDFLMSLLGYSVGLGNVWRFPYLAYSNGGGAFLFPFILMFLLLGFPMMFMELSFGQFAAVGPAMIFDRICPLLSGIGFGMVVVSCLVSIYYTCIIGWAFLYMFKSFQSELPWERCHPEWATTKCYSHLEAEECQKNNSIYYMSKCYDPSEAALNNISTLTHNKADRTPPAQDYFERGILHISDGIDDMGTIQWQIMLCLLLTWTLTFLALSKGVKSVGKVVYFTALFPYFVLFILFFRGVTLDGAKDGIIYYLTPEFSKLIDAKTWVSAAVQIFFALSPAWGGLITLSSYNKFHNNCFKDSLIVGVGNICTSIFAGFVIFSIVGYLAKELDMDVDKVVNEGPGLAFVVFPDVVTRLPPAPMWSFLFFFMLITLGMGSEFALLETVMTAIQDTFPKLRNKKVYVVAITSVMGFLFGLSITTEGGMYLLQLMDTFCASWAVFLMAILECVILGWIYGADNFIKDIELMIGHRSRHWHLFFTAFWRFLTPLTLCFLLVFNFVDYSRMSYNKKVYPIWAELLGWLMASIPVIIIFVFAVLKWYQSPKERTIYEKFRRLMHKSPKWGPAHKVQVFDQPIFIESARTVSNPGFASQGMLSPTDTRI